MMPDSYVDLIPAVPEPVYKYSSEGASKYKMEWKSNFKT